MSLLVELMIYLLVIYLIGLLVGWFIWGSRRV